MIILLYTTNISLLYSIKRIKLIVTKISDNAQNMLSTRVIQMIIPRLHTSHAYNNRYYTDSISDNAQQYIVNKASLLSLVLIPSIAFTLGRPPDTHSSPIVFMIMSKQKRMTCCSTIV